MTDIVSVYSQKALAYDQWFKDHHLIFQSELLAIKTLMPATDNILEVGVGTGVFAEALQVKKGLEPAEGMAALAKKRGIDLVQGYAEDMPFPDSSFDAVLMITVLCFLENPNKAFSEIRRVLKPDGQFILAILDKATPLGQLYDEHKHTDAYFRYARFFTAEECITLLTQSGFKITDTRQTISSLNLQDIEEPTEGHGKGCFVVFKSVRA